MSEHERETHEQSESEATIDDLEVPAEQAEEVAGGAEYVFQPAWPTKLDDPPTKRSG